MGCPGWEHRSTKPLSLAEALGVWEMLVTGQIAFQTLFLFDDHLFSVYSVPDWPSVDSSNDNIFYILVACSNCIL